MRQEEPWHQLNLAFPDWTRAEAAAATHLAPIFNQAEDEGLITCWFFIRKHPCWRIRYQLSNGTFSDPIPRRLALVRARGDLTHATPIIYEPEMHAFGGPAGLTCAHRLFHLDSKHALAYLAGTDASGHRRELSVLLASELLRGAQLDWYEQGDAWARIADHRPLPDGLPKSRVSALEEGLRRLMTVEIGQSTSGNGPLGFAKEWATALASGGQELASLAAAGLLHRGLRDLLAHHLIFSWNRLGLPYETQALLAHAAQLTVFGPDPTKAP